MTMPQNSPLIRLRPSISISGFMAGTFGNPGMVTISPVRATSGSCSSAPAETFRFRTVTVKPLGAPQQGGVVGKAVLGLGHADGQFPEPQLCQPPGLLLGGRRQYHAVRMVNPPADSLQLLFDGPPQRMAYRSPDGCSHSRTTSSAKAVPPAPPLAHTSLRATLTPSSRHFSSTSSAPPPCP